MRLTFVHTATSYEARLTRATPGGDLIDAPTVEIDAALKSAEEWLLQQQARLPEPQRAGAGARAVITAAPVGRPKTFVYDPVL